MNEDELGVDNDFMVIYIKALAGRLDEDQGVIVHHNETGFVVYKNTVNKTMGIQEDIRFLKYPHGTLVSTGVTKKMKEMEIEAIAHGNEEEVHEIYTPVGDPVKKMKN